MRKILFTLLLAVSSITAIAQTEILQNFDPTNLGNYSNGNTYPLQVARFDLPQPGYLESVSLHVGGGTGTLNLRIFGHEGGTSFPQLLDDLIPPILISKTSTGNDVIHIPLSESILLNNNQFFIAIDQPSSGMGVRIDPSSYPLPCSSSNGGDYYTHFLLDNSNQWFLGTGNLGIEAHLNYIEQTGTPYLQDITAQSGIDLELSNRSISAGDLNADGRPDLLVSGRVYYNGGQSDFYDVSAQAGIIDPETAVRANALIDIDNDGDLDILILGHLYSNLFLNQGGFVFEKLTTNLPPFPNAVSFSIADINKDNYPDVFVSQLWGTYPVPLPNYLFLNDASNGFIDATAMIYADYDGTSNFPNATLCDPDNQGTWLSGGNTNRRSRGSQFVDFDNDQDLDLYVVNYFLEQDEFYRYDHTNGTFTNIINEKNIDENNTGSNHGTGVDWFDYDNDEDMDLLLSQFAHPGFQLQYDHRGTTIYRNEGGNDPVFTDMQGQHNIQFEETHAGAVWGDVNNDGLADFAITVYYGCRYADLYIQQEDHSFEMKSYEYGLSGYNTGVDACWLDLNNDGKLDLAMGENYRVRVFQNQGPFDDQNFVTVSLSNPEGLQIPIGSRVKVYANGSVFTRDLVSGRGQNIQNDHRLHFGLGDHSNIDSVSVDWYGVDGSPEIFYDVAINSFITLVQGNSTTAITEALESSLRLFPNPASEQVILEWDNSSTQNYEVLIHDIYGRQHLAPAQTTSSGQVIDISQLPAGLYFFSLHTSSGLQYIEQLVVK